ncbi:NfeD family protein [Methylocystis sp. JAN1]|uniref:NfeD family protein n=1 Tax=Methylocystis sp. JAN1 TaxID=3397211 RepID=UPI003FA2B0B4
MEPSFLFDPANASLIAGLVLLAIDILVIGLSPVMFVGAGSIAASLLLYVTGWRPALAETLALIAGASLLVALIGWRPLQRFQAADVQEDQSSDLVGRELVTTHDVTKDGGRVHWSGLDWEARLAADAPVERLGPGARARVARVENLTLVLAPL